MKYLLFALLFVAARQLAASDYPSYEMPSFEPHISKNTTYVKLGGASIFVGSGGNIAPTFGIGKRYECSATAIDFSVTASYQSGDNYMYQLPRVAYLIYLNPNCNQSFYYGGGLSWMIAKRKEKHKKEVVEEEDATVYTHETRKFCGITAEVALGYQMSRFSEFITFIEFGVVQPILATQSSHCRYTPSLTLSFGAGF